MFFVLPIRDTPRAEKLPWGTYGIIALNVAVFVLVTLPLMGRGINPRDPMAIEYIRYLQQSTGAVGFWEQISAYDLFVFRYGFRPAAPSVVSLLTHMFIHGGAMHLVGNMLFLWIAGHNVEAKFGTRRFVAAYIVMGVVAGIAFAILSGGVLPMVGASGAVFGVLGCYFVWFPQNRVTLLVIFIWLIRTVQVHAGWVLAVYILFSDVLPFMMGSTEGDSVAHSAHIGGFLAGLVIAVLTPSVNQRRTDAFYSHR